MVELTALTPCDGLLPLTIGTVTLDEVRYDRITSVAPFAGQDVSAVLPSMNQRSETAIWAGHGVWMVLGDAPEGVHAATTDQSDAWAIVRLSGADAEAVLARLVPVDLRAVQFPEGSVAKTMLAHLSVSVSRVGADAFEIWAMRSMAKTLVHDLEVAMTSVAAR